MTWTKEPPKEPGWYWAAGVTGFGHAIVRVEKRGERLFAYDAGDNAPHPADEIHEWWSEPIKEPEP